MKPMKYPLWLKQTVYVSKGLAEGTMEEAMLDFFYNGISPWMKGIGYTWIIGEEKYIAQKFLRFAYECYCALKQGPTMDIYAPEPMHRNLPVDRETFEIYADIPRFMDFLDHWSFREEIVGTRVESMIREFCYTWIDVTSGKPGKWTQATLDMSDEHCSDEDTTNMFPDGNWSRRKHDLY